MRSVNAAGGEESRVAGKKKSDPTPPVRKLSISLPQDVAEFVERSWRDAELQDGSQSRNVSQFIADVLRREMDRRAIRAKRR
jgi:hypothetical protein